MGKRTVLVVLLLLASIAGLWGQARPNYPTLSASAFGGFLIAHRSNIKHLVTGHLAGTQVQAEWRANPHSRWAKEYSHPTLGVDLSFSGTGNPDQMGYLLAATGFTRLPLNDKPSTKHSLVLGLGLGYGSRIWDLQDNVRAPVLGSHLNTSILLQYEWRLPVFNSAEIRTGFRVHHLSNGAFQLPNLGTNVAAVFVGLSPSMPSQSEWHNPKTEEDMLQTRPSVTRLDTSTLSLNLGLGIKEVQDPLGEKYSIFQLGALYAKRVSYKSSFSAGLDVFFNRSMSPLLYPLEGEASFDEQLLAGVSVGYGLHFDAWTFRVMFGRYLIDPWGGYGDWYSRFGLRYWINDRFFASMMLKTHFAKADVGEWGIGMRIGR